MAEEIEEINWTRFMEAIKALAARLPNGSVLAGIPRGGLLVALLLQYQQPDRFKLKQLGEKLTENDILVDDIADTGSTLMHARSSAHVFTAVLFKRHSCVFEVDFVQQIVPHNHYVLMPYENPSSEPWKGAC